MNPEEALDQLLADSGHIEPAGSDVLLAARNTVLAEARATAARAAKIVRLRRRHRRLTVGISTVAAAGIVAAIVVSGGSVPNDENITASPGQRSQAPVEQNFTTVAQVVNAAATASDSVDPTAAPYWKVVTSWDCTGVPDADETPRPAGSMCQNKMWTGNGRPGVLEDINGEALQVPEGTVVIGGRSLTWKQANNRKWTDAQIASMVADHGSSTQEERAPSGHYIFKNAIGLLTYTPASSTIRKQLWRELAAVPGVTFDGTATDALGRTGWRLTWKRPAWGMESIIIDTSTGLPLEQSDRAPKRKKANVTTIVSVEPTDTAPVAPTAKELRRQKLAIARACGVIPASPTPPGTIRPQVGRMHRLTTEQQACLDSGDRTHASAE